jgi:hypothetical protein
MKKILYSFSVFILSLSLASCFNFSFSFKGLSVDFSNAESLGLMNLDNASENNQRASVYGSGRKMSASNQVSNTQLVQIDINGEIIPVQFMNDNGSAVDIPYYLYYFEVFGDFTYLIYYKTESDLAWLNGQFAAAHRAQVRNTSIINFLFMTSEDNDWFDGIDDTVKEIAIHNRSGKIFDYTEIFNEIFAEDEIFIHHFNIVEDGQFISSYNAELRSNTCTYAVKFNEDGENLVVDKVCSEVWFFPIVGFDNNNFIFEIFDEQGEYFYINGESSEIENKTVSKYILNDDRTIEIYWSDTTVSLYDYNFNLIETKTLFETENETSFEFNEYENPIFTIKNNKLLYKHRGVLYILDLLTNEILLEYHLEHNSHHNEIHFSLGKDIYFISDRYVLRFDIDNLKVDTIYSGSPLQGINGLERNNIVLESFRATGFIKLTYIEGITFVTKIIDPITGEVVSSSESGSSKNTWFVTPLN